MLVTGRCAKVESVSEGLKLTIYVKDEAQIDEAFRLLKKDVSLSLAGTGTTEGVVKEKEVVGLLAMSALQAALDSMYADEQPKIAEDLAAGTLQAEQLSLVEA